MILKSYNLKLIRDKSINYEAEEVLTPEKAADIARKFIEQNDRENLIVIALDARNQAVGVNLAHTGTVDASLTSAREIFKFALLCNATSIIICHNHPSGSPSPSEDDIKLTRNIINSGALLSVNLQDHVIITESDYYSMRGREFSLPWKL